MKKIRKNSLASRIMFGFIITIVSLGAIIFLCCQYYNVSYAKENYKRLAESCARSVATSLFNAPFEKYLQNGKDELYNKQLASLNSICKNFNLKYLYVYIPDFKNNELTSIFYVDGKSNGNVANRDLGTIAKWNITQQEKDIFNGIDNNKMYVVKNYMGHTVTSYAVIRNSKGEPMALVGADLDFNSVVHEILFNILKIIIFISVCLLTIYSVLIIYLNKTIIKPIVEISSKMAHFTTVGGQRFEPITVTSNDEIGLMATSFNKMVYDIDRYVQKIADTQMETIFSLAKLAQSRDDETGKHLERVRQYCIILTGQLQKDSPYSSFIDEKFLKNISNASALHDVGKVGIPDAILLKPVRHTPEEFEIMKKHTVIGYETLKEVNEKFGTNTFIEMGMLIALYHHERWDGKGYPYGLEGTDIPLVARIMAIADVYDALSTKRVYKPPFTQEECVNIIKNGRGTQFDPAIVDAFLQVTDEFYQARCSLED